MKINIKAAMNSGTDILGKFYEVFLKYGNGAKDIGIVLTPRNITEFACEALNISYNDLVYDPTCGTGGFLVSAFDYVRNHSTSEQTAEFRKHRIFGVEQQPRIAALAIVNMIFRGDGSNNIIDNNCLSIGLDELVLNSSKSAEYKAIDKEKIERPPVTKALMNPPFALKSKDEKEYKFIQHALNQMEDGGLLFAIIPLSVVIKSGDNKKWRHNQLLKSNTLISVITLPPNLFNSVGVHTCAIIIKKGIPHIQKQNVLWLRCINDGYKIKKGKRITDLSIQNDLYASKNLLKLFILDQSIEVENIPEFQKACPVNYNDKSFELLPEAYLDIKDMACIYNDFAEQVKRVLEVPSMIYTFNTADMPRYGSAVWGVEKKTLEQVLISAKMLLASLEGNNNFVDDEFDNICNFFSSRLRAVIFNKPDKEVEVQNWVESLLLGRGLSKGTDYDRESGKIEFSRKKFIPDFFIPKLNLCIEIKLLRAGRKSKVIEEISETLPPIKKYTSVSFTLHMI